MAKGRIVMKRKIIKAAKGAMKEFKKRSLKNLNNYQKGFKHGYQSAKVKNRLGKTLVDASVGAGLGALGSVYLTTEYHEDKIKQTRRRSFEIGRATAHSEIKRRKFYNVGELEKRKRRR